MANLSPFRGSGARAEFIEAYDAVMHSWPVPFEERGVETACGQTHLVVSGPPSAPPLVLLHAASATSAMWSPIIAAMSSSYRCYCIDTITEANKSVATKRLYSVADHVDWLRQVFAAIGLAERTGHGHVLRRLAGRTAGAARTGTCQPPGYYLLRPEP